VELKGVMVSGTGGLRIFTVAFATPLHPWASVTLRLTLYVPGFEYDFMTFCRLEPVVSPKLHNQFNIADEDEPVKLIGVLTQLGEGAIFMVGVAFKIVCVIE
jgi:hypothetical protein